MDSAEVRGPYRYFLFMFVVIAVSIVAAMGVISAWREYTHQTECLHRELHGKIPKWEGLLGVPDKAIVSAETEAIAFVTLRKYRSPDAGLFEYTKVCSEKFWRRFWREVQAFSVLDLFKLPDIHRDDVMAVAQRAYRHQYRYFDARKYQCAREFASGINLPPGIFSWTSYVKVGEPIGRIQLYGPKEECERK